MRALRKWWWLALVLFAGLNLIAGAWLERTVDHELESQLVHELTTIRDLNVAALREWLRGVERAAESTASDRDVSAAALEIVRTAEHAGSPAELAALPALPLVRKRLESSLRIWDISAWVLIADRRVVGASHDTLLGLPVPNADLPEAARRGATAIDLPHRPSVDAFDKRETLMWVITSVRNDAGKGGALLALRLDTEKTFTRLLETARFGDSGETYAINGDGLFLSSSRFDDDLVKKRILEAGTRSALVVSAREPSASPLPGPLTRAARAATSHASGADIRGYGDYRGAEVVGAWTWLDDFGFAVLTELDRSEAYRSTRVIRLASRGLTVVVFFSALVIGATSAVFRRLERRARRTERLGQYVLEALIGEGASGKVYRARHVLLRRPTAIKILKDDVEKSLVERFEREVQTTARLTHPNTIAIYDYGRTDKGTFYYAMELLDGRSLEDLVAREGRMGPAQAIHVLVQILGSLGEAHDRGLVHRDVKPANVMLCTRGGIMDYVKVVDFGLVKDARVKTQLTHSQAILGTPHYMSPEALQEPGTVDARSDLYAVGGIAIFLLTGKCAVEGENLMAVISKQLIDPPPSLAAIEDVPPELEALVHRLLAKSRDDRPSRARDVIDALEQIREAHGLKWSEADARAWWDAHPVTSVETSRVDAAPGSVSMHISLEERERASSSAAEPRSATEGRH